MTTHPVKDMGLSEEHVAVFDQIAHGDLRRQFDQHIVRDLEKAYLIERDGIGNLNVSLIVLKQWSDYQDETNTD